MTEASVYGTQSRISLLHAGFECLGLVRALLPRERQGPDAAPTDGKAVQRARRGEAHGSGSGRPGGRWGRGPLRREDAAALSPAPWNHFLPPGRTAHLPFARKDMMSVGKNTSKFYFAFVSRTS